MNRETIIQMALEAGLAEVTDTAESLPADYVEALANLCALAVSKEREACAKVCDELAQYTLDAQNNELSSLENVMLRQISKLGHNKCASAIRARWEAV